MNLIICLDEKNGMMFNRRRQSRDEKVNEKILELAKGKKLFMNPNSAKMFDCQVCVDENPLLSAQAEDFCFAEEKIQNLNNTQKIFIFLWNRRYPADVFFDFDLEKEGFVLAETQEFVGKAHEKITLNVFERIMK